MDDLIKAFGKLAPAIGTAIGGPVGGAIGLGVKSLATAMTGEDDPLKAAEVMRQNPDLLVQFETRVKELELEHLRVHAADRDSARRMQMQTGSKMPAFIAFMALAGFFGILGVMAFHPIPPGAESGLNIMLGVLGGMVGAIANFYFGSSVGSKMKTALMKE